MFVRPVVEVVLEEGESNWGAYSNALPGAVGVGDTPGEALQSVEQSLTMAFEAWLQEVGRFAEQHGDLPDGPWEVAMAARLAEAASKAGKR